MNSRFFIRSLAGCLAFSLSAAVWAEEAPFPRLPRSQFKSGESVLRAFRPVVKSAAQATVRIVEASDGPRETPRALGVIVDRSGLILTKASLLASSNAARLADGRLLKATVLASDAESDTALLKVDAGNLPVIAWSDRTPEVGQFLATVAPDEDPVAVGIVSVRNREIAPEKGVLGIAVTDDKPGPKVTEIIPESGAAKAGLKVGDLIVEIGGEAIQSVPALLERLGGHRPGTALIVKVRREDQTVAVNAVLGRRPGNGPDRGEFQNSLGGELSVRRDGFASVLQHDTVLSPQECGGPVVGLDGKALGLNIARAGRTESYALPASAVVSLLAELRAKAAPAGTTAQKR